MNTGAAGLTVAITLHTTNAERTEDLKEAGVSSWIMIGAFDWGQALVGLLLMIVLVQAVAIFVMAMNNRKKPEVIIVKHPPAENGEENQEQGRQNQGENVQRPMEYQPPPPVPIHLPDPAPVPFRLQEPARARRGPHALTNNRMITVTETGHCFHYATCRTIANCGVRHLRPCHNCNAVELLARDEDQAAEYN